MSTTSCTRSRRASTAPDERRRVTARQGRRKATARRVKKAGTRAGPSVEYMTKEIRASVVTIINELTEGGLDESAAAAAAIARVAAEGGRAMQS